MALTSTPVCEFGKKAGEFSLPATDSQVWTLQQCAGPAGLVIVFISNHCPYVRAINQKLVRDALGLHRLGVHFAAIMPNDTTRYPEDSLPNMIRVAAEQNYPFPYLLDESQEVARTYGAVCTPDFFGYNAKLELQYRGRLDECGARSDCPGEQRELFLAMKLVAETGRGPRHQVPSMGCSIKWRQV